MVLYKTVNGERVQMSKAEEAEMLAERTAEAQRPPPKALEERVAEIEKRLSALEKLPVKNVK